MLSKLGRRAANEWLHASGLPVLLASAADVERAKALLADYDDKDWSLCDTISFVVAERKKALVFTFDHHFLQYPKLTVWGLKR